MEHYGWLVWSIVAGILLYLILFVGTSAGWFDSLFKDTSCEDAMRQGYASCWYDSTRPMASIIQEAIDKCKTAKERFPACEDEYSEVLSCFASREFKDGACDMCKEQQEDLEICVRREVSLQ